MEQIARRGGWNVARRSRDLTVDAEPRQDVVVLDSIGELAQLYQVATAVFVGGALVDQGGHNILEPAVFGKAIVFGPYMQNFAEIARTFVENDAAIQIRSGRELEHGAPQSADRSGPPCQARRGRACARRGQPRRPRQDDDRDRARAASAGLRQRAPVPGGPLISLGSTLPSRAPPPRLITPGGPICSVSSIVP